MNKDISIMLIKWQRTYADGHSISGGDHCGCTGAVSHWTNSCYAAPHWSLDIPNHTEENVSGSTTEVRCLWTVFLFTTFLSFTSHKLPNYHGLYIQSSLYATPAHSAIYKLLGTSCQCCPGDSLLLGQETEKQRKVLFQGRELVSSLQSSIPFPLTSPSLTCHPQLQAGTKCTVYYTYTQRQCVCTHKPPLLSFLSLSLWIVLENAVKHEMALLMPSAQMCLAWNSCLP